MLRTLPSALMAKLSVLDARSAGLRCQDSTLAASLGTSLISTARASAALLITHLVQVWNPSG